MKCEWNLYNCDEDCGHKVIAQNIDNAGTQNSTTWSDWELLETSKLLLHGKSIEQNFPNFQLSLQLNMPDQREHVLLKCGKVSPFSFNDEYDNDCNFAGNLMNVLNYI